jgi:hypothetical protein
VAAADGSLVLTGVRGITRIAADGGSAPSFRAMKHDDLSNAPVIADLAHFDAASGSWAERLLFNHRRVILVLCLLITAVLAWGRAACSSTRPSRR